MPEFNVGRCASCAKVTQPGFLCKDHAITMCPSGFYCPLDAITGSYTEQKTCPDKHVCMPGFVAPLECREFESCKEGTGPSFAYSLPVHSFHTRRDRVASLTTCRLHGAGIQRASPGGLGRA